MKKSKNKPRISLLLVIDALYGGGAERVFSNLAENLDQKAVKPICLFYTPRHLYLPSPGIKTYTLTNHDNAKRSNRITKIAQIIDYEKVDIVISFLKHVNVETVIARGISRRKPKLVLTEHTTPSISPQTYQTVGNLKYCLPPSMYGIIENAAFKKYPRINPHQNNNKQLADMIKILYPSADMVCAVSGGVKDDLQKNFAIEPQQIQVIYNGVDIEKVSRLAKEKIPPLRWFHKKTPWVINVAALRMQKGQEYLLQMLEILKPNTDCRLAIFGTGERKTELKNLAYEMDIQDNVKFFGFHRNPFKFMAHANIFILSSLCEGCPNTLLEAMCCGTPILSTNCPSGPAEIIKDGYSGLLVPVKDPVSMANACLRLLNDKQLSSWLCANAKKEVHKFSLNKMLEGYTRLIRRLAE